MSKLNADKVQVQPYLMMATLVSRTEAQGLAGNSESSMQANLPFVTRVRGLDNTTHIRMSGLLVQLRPGVCKNPHPIQYLIANFDKIHIPGSVERICLNLFLCVFSQALFCLMVLSLCIGFTMRSTMAPTLLDHEIMDRLVKHGISLSLRTEPSTVKYNVVKCPV